jgi:hypothetical protein
MVSDLGKGVIGVSILAGVGLFAIFSGKIAEILAPKDPETGLGATKGSGSGDVRFTEYGEIAWGRFPGWMRSEVKNIMGNDIERKIKATTGRSHLTSTIQQYIDWQPTVVDYFP